MLGAFEPPFKGRLTRETVESTKQIWARIVAFAGGQWPHATYMMPGGVTCPVNREKLCELSGCHSSVRYMVSDNRFGVYLRPLGFVENC